MRERAKTPLVTAEVVGEDQIQRCPRLRIVFVVPGRIVPTSAVGHLLGRQAEHEEVLLARFVGHLDRGSVAGANGQRPFIMNFILLVPLAS